MPSRAKNEYIYMLLRDSSRLTVCKLFMYYMILNIYHVILTGGLWSAYSKARKFKRKRKIKRI